MAIEDKYDQVRQLIAMGKERGYLLYDEVNDLLPAEVHSSEEIDDVLTAFDDAGIEILDAAKRFGDPEVFRRVILEDIALAKPTPSPTT